MHRNNTRIVCIWELPIIIPVKFTTKTYDVILYYPVSSWDDFFTAVIVDAIDTITWSCPWPCPPLPVYTNEKLCLPPCIPRPPLPWWKCVHGGSTLSHVPTSLTYILKATVKVNGYSSCPWFDELFRLSSDVLYFASSLFKIKHRALKCSLSSAISSPVTSFIVFF